MNRSGQIDEHTLAHSVVQVEFFGGPDEKKSGDDALDIRS